MIAYVLLFALGFLAATLVGLLVAPAIHGRVVRFTEERLKATMPLSPQEVRAQKDMARAAYAAENARVSDDLRRTRDKLVQATVDHERLVGETSKLNAENADLQAQIAEMNVEAGDLRSAMRRETQKLDQMKSTLDASERESRSSHRDIEHLTVRLHDLLSDIDTVKIDLAARETEIESLKSRVSALRDERDKLREDLKISGVALREVQSRLSHEEGRSRQLDTRLTRELAGSSDKDNVIERRIAEINRLKEKLKTVTNEAKEATRLSRMTGIARSNLLERMPAKKGSAEKIGRRTKAPVDLQALDEDVRNQSSALSERLLSAKSGANDAALREEIADIATKMIVLTAAREGQHSPVHDLLAAVDPEKIGAKSLARRSLDALDGSEG
ncbi:hypothetical protein [Sinorhizobium sp. BG8]|uniref:hypothetical protein n=1 Tax=Sinorhizobium sp. BG8 TaxID=2613773 RepID=UPI00193E42D6|nr:hypothetical protein [Sinorhizobium sp. BG8]QRM56569.1 hypothetical protein F3Y30_20055 [Sinorhizobium sp. BG8]